MRKILLASLAAIPAALAAANIDLRDGDIRLDQWSGTFATKLNGYYSIVVQTDYDRVVLKVVPAGAEPTADERKEVEHIVHMVMGEECRTDIELVDEIPNSESGKYRYTLSLLDSS